jgi:hypothetical protein
MATTYAVSAGDHMRPLQMDPRLIKHFPEDATQSFEIGDVLIKGAAGLENKVKIAAANPTADIVGVAAEAASGVTGNMVAVYCALPHVKFIARAVAADGLDYTDIGTARALDKHATHTHVWTVHTDDAGNDSVIVRGYRSPDGRDLAEGDFEMEVIVDFKLGATIWGSET